LRPRISKYRHSAPLRDSDHNRKYAQETQIGQRRRHQQRQQDESVDPRRRLFHQAQHVVGGKQPCNHVGGDKRCHRIVEPEERGRFLDHRRSDEEGDDGKVDDDRRQLKPESCRRAPVIKLAQCIAQPCQG
jgi:hypothetical protein